MADERARRAVMLGVTTMLGAATLLGGCVYRTEKTVPAAASPPTTVVVTQPSQRAVTYPEGRWELRGDGSGDSPYYWIWIPTGATPPNPPAPPRLPR